MMKNVLIISTSPRKGGNSDMLATEFAKGAKEAGNAVEIVNLAGKKIEFCRGCLSCVKTQKCIIDDDATEIRNKMLNADVIVWATPIYYYCISGQMKTMIDRGNPLYTSDYKFRDIYLLAAAAEDDDYTVEGAVKATQGWIDCFEKASLKGVVFAGGVDKNGDIAGHKALTEAYEMGKNL
ncbi:MAG: flavodoxin family protein [Bacteroidaceae bacterium]|nr:flavodoxin family protein [Bacteroidaceae bacterium]